MGRWPPPWRRWAGRLSKVAVYYAVQEAGAAVAGLRREAVRRGGGRVVALGVDLTSVRCAGQWLTVGVSVDAVTGPVLSLDLLPNGEAATLTAWVQDLAAALDAEILVSDDADGFKTAADEVGLLAPGLQSPCPAQYRGVGGGHRTPPWPAMPMAPWPPRGHPSQAVADCQELRRLMTERQPTPRRQRPWPPSTTATWAPPRPRRAGPCRWPIGCGCSAWIAGTCGGG